MISHSDRARKWVGKNIYEGPGANDWPVADLAAEFERLLPEGSVAVDWELLKALYKWWVHTEPGDPGMCGSWEDDYDCYQLKQRIRTALSLPDCPLGGDDV